MRDLRASCIQSPLGGVVTPQYVDGVLSEADAALELVVLPELCTVPYFPLETGSRDAEHPLPLDGAEVAAFAAVARKHSCHLMLGAYLAEGERRFNAAVLLGPGGEVQTGRTSRGGRARSYHKVHLCDVQLPTVSFCESEYFDPGKEYVVWDTPFGCVGALICYDRHFPEAWVTLRELGAEIVGVCTTSGLNMEGTFVPEMQAMSLQQSVYALTANRVGVEVLGTSGRQTEFLGESCITGPVGERIAAARPRVEHPLVFAELEAAGLERIRAAHQFHEHRRPTTYAAARPEQERTTA